MLNFSQKRKGYDKAEVESYIEKQAKYHEEIERSQQLRVEELKDENRKLFEQIEKYRSKEESVSEALLSAIEKAKEMDYTTKIRFALEGERIKIFEAKWTSYCKENFVKHSIRSDISGFLAEVDKEIKSIMEEELNLVPTRNTSEVEKQFFEETTRLAEAEKSKIREFSSEFSKQKKTKSSARIKDESGFNLDDLSRLSDIDGICDKLFGESK